MEEKNKLETEVIRLQLDFLNCKLERLTNTKSFHESILDLYTSKESFLKDLIEKQKRLHFIEHRILVEIEKQKQFYAIESRFLKDAHKNSPTETFIGEVKKNFQKMQKSFQDMEQDMKKNFQKMEEDLTQLEETKSLLSKDIEQSKKLLKDSEKEILAVQKEKDLF